MPARRAHAAGAAVPSASAEPVPVVDPDDRSDGRHPERSAGPVARSRPLPGSTRRPRSRSASSRRTKPNSSSKLERTRKTCRGYSDYIEDTAADNVSSPKPRTCRGYSEDTQIWTLDNGGSLCVIIIDRPRSVTDGVLRPGSVARSSRAGTGRGGICGQRGALRPTTGTGGRALRDKPAVEPSQDLAEGPGPAGDGAVADLAARDREMGNGHGEAAGTSVLITSHVASPVAVALPSWRPAYAARHR